MVLVGKAGKEETLQNILTTRWLAFNNFGGLVYNFGQKGCCASFPLGLVHFWVPSSQNDLKRFATVAGNLEVHTHQPFTLRVSYITAYWKLSVLQIHHLAVSGSLPIDWNIYCCLVGSLLQLQGLWKLLSFTEPTLHCPPEPAKINKPASGIF